MQAAYTITDELYYLGFQLSPLDEFVAATLITLQICLPHSEQHLKAASHPSHPSPLKTMRTDPRIKKLSIRNDAHIQQYDCHYASCRLESCIVLQRPGAV